MGGSTGSEKGNGGQSTEPGGSAPVKFALAAPKAKFSASRPPPFPKGKRSSVDGSEDKEYVTGFDQQGVIVKDSKARVGGPRVIPKLENSWRPEKRMKNIVMDADLMEDTSLRFESEKLVGDATPSTVYGLSVGVKKLTTRDTTDANVQVVAVEKHAEVTTKLVFSQSEDQRLKQDLSSLPEESSMDIYEDMPVEDFGEAMLRGMGWEKGKPIGRYGKGVVTPGEFVRRTGRRGLGAEAATPVDNGKKVHKTR